MAALMAALPALSSVMPVLSAVGTVVGALGAIRQGEAQQAAANYNAQIARNNANAAEVVGQQEAGRLYDINRRKQASAQNQFGAAGVQVDLGSPVDVAADLAAQSALDEEIARWRGKVQATGYRNEATAQVFAGQQAMSAAYGRAGGMLLTGFGRLAGGGAASTAGTTGGAASSSLPWFYGYP